MADIVNYIRDYFFQNADVEYKEFNSKLIPTVNPDTVIGVRTPILRKFAKEIAKREDATDFLERLPHLYYEENNLHGFIVEQIKDYDRCIEEVERFLPYIDNWATCDLMSPKIFRKHKKELLERITVWLKDERTYTIRFGIEMLMSFFLDEDFEEGYLEMVAKVRSEEYYVNMMIAWYFATALAKQYEKTLPYIEEKRLDKWVHNKTIQKAVESYRITEEQKKYLRTFRIK